MSDNRGNVGTGVDLGVGISCGSSPILPLSYLIISLI